MGTSRILRFVCRSCTRKTVFIPARQFTTSRHHRRKDDPAFESPTSTKPAAEELTSKKSTPALPSTSSGPSTKSPLSTLANLLAPSPSPFNIPKGSTPSNAYTNILDLDPQKLPNKPNAEFLKSTGNNSRSKTRNPSMRGSSDILIGTIDRAMRTRTPKPNFPEAKAAREKLTAQKKDLEWQAPRVWRTGDIYAPKDLSAKAMLASKIVKSQRGRPNFPLNSRKKGGRDVLDDLGINPIKEYKNFALMDGFITDLGRIKHSRITGCRAVNQRKISKAVRRAHGMGLLPSVHRHPEMMPETKALRQGLPTPIYGRLNHRGRAITFRT